LARVLFVAGATGGHVYPAIAIAQSMITAAVCFFTTPNREDCRIVSRYGFRFHPYLSESKNPISIFRSFLMIFVSLVLSRPSVIVATGGGTTAIVLACAVFLRIPIVLCEQNVLPGRVVRLFSGYAKKVCISFEETRSYLSGGRVVCTGNPVRSSFKEDTEVTKEIERLNSSLKTILVFGGSQGARFITDFFIANSALFLNEEINIILVAGRGYFQSRGLSERVEITQVGSASLLMIDYTEAMDILYRSSDLVVSRAGATSISELIEFNKSAVLIPYPFAKDNHQALNADVFVASHSGRVCSQENLTVPLVLESLGALSMSNRGSNTQSATNLIGKEIAAFLE
jgi:UDP-N-acetylglucosamine--N-acetylmuramyl-(pentapeptide) pyrophosphoryl-undecaprenol N-acetylglucosamine transferase